MISYLERRLLLEDVGQAHASVLDEASEVVHLYCFAQLKDCCLMLERSLSFIWSTVP
jgi:hypothetical protein